MKIKHTVVLFLVLTVAQICAQESKKMSLREAVSIAIAKSNEAILADLKVESAQVELTTVKNNLYPNLRLSGQYLKLTEPVIGGALLGNGGNSASQPDVNALLLGQANFTMPLFQGFRLRNNVAVSELFLKSQTYQTTHLKEQIALRVTELFAKLYQANQTQKLFEDNLTAAKQREKDFSNAVDNGLLAKNDLLKAQLQSSTVQLGLDSAIKNAILINYQLITLLQLPENATIDIDIETIKTETAASQLQNVLGQRNDLEAVNLQGQASKTGIKLAKANFYPAINLIGGYIAFDLKNALRATNAINVGVGISYDVTSLFKNNSAVKLAESKSKQSTLAAVILSEKIKEEIKEADENYKLAKKQNTVYNQAVAQSAENFRIVKDKYENGLSNTNDLLEADVQQLNAKINLALSQADLALRYYQAQFASGKLINSFNLNSK